jgi:alcohol dehydrogenase (NADP+)
VCVQVFVDVLYCGMCHSDLHKVCDDWDDFVKYPMVPGHEVVGIVKAAGPKVANVKVGDRVGFGPQRDCCRSCGPCAEKLENICECPFCILLFSNLLIDLLF